MENQVIEPGDEIEIIQSAFPHLIGKKYRVAYCSEDDIFLPNVNGCPVYGIARTKIKLSRKRNEFNCWSQPSIKGGNCISCSKFSEYQESDFTCYECQNV